MDSRLKTIGERVLSRTPYGVAVEGVDVIIHVNGKGLRMDYSTALKLSAFLRNAGRIAKRKAGDESRKFTVFADLTEANFDELEAQRSRDGSAVFSR